MDGVGGARAGGRGGGELRFHRPHKRAAGKKEHDGLTPRQEAVLAGLESLRQPETFRKMAFSDMPDDGRDARHVIDLPTFLQALHQVDLLTAKQSDMKAMEKKAVSKVDARRLFRNASQAANSAAWQLEEWSFVESLRAVAALLLVPINWPAPVSKGLEPPPPGRQRPGVVPPLKFGPVASVPSQEKSVGMNWKSPMLVREAGHLERDALLSIERHGLQGLGDMHVGLLPHVYGAATAR